MADEPNRQIDLFADDWTDFKRYAGELTDPEKKILREALAILDRTLRRPGAALTSPELVADYLKFNIATRPHEVFVVLFLDNQHCLIETKELFRGTIDAASVYPREVVKEALQLNASAVILAHNHPSGIAEPSQADYNITRKIKDALDVVEIRTLDHMIIGGTSHMSFSERGLMPS
jgi:DNA repair protein RadC